eukprot:395439-Pleurochrysis_carterae.AAC.1
MLAPPCPTGIRAHALALERLARRCMSVTPTCTQSRSRSPSSLLSHSPRGTLVAGSECASSSAPPVYVAQVPSAWRPTMEDAATTQLFFDIYSSSAAPASARALEARRDTRRRAPIAASLALHHVPRLLSCSPQSPSACLACASVRPFAVSAGAGTARVAATLALLVGRGARAHA